MTTELQTKWLCSESGFDSHDSTRLFYRIWQPLAIPADQPQKALIFLHRGHEHSGRIGPLVEQFGFTQDWAFAWDARGHGNSPGERGDAPDFQTMVRDFDSFINHIQQSYGIAKENMSEQKAVALIVDAITARRDRLVFPWQMKWLIAVLNVLPRWVLKLRK